jgi:hypothetical protein
MIYEEISLLYYSFNHNTAFFLLLEEHIATHSALLEISKALFASAADVTAAARALWFVVSQRCQRLKIKMFM